jgi:hypothetical protein
MINKICFTADWLNRKRKELKTDPYLLERALHAFALLGHLAESGLDFVFKGGTSLLLHVPVIRRLSIDIDILCSAPAETLGKILAEVASVEPFIRFEEDDRGARGLPRRRHFKFYYNPVLEGNPAPFVILDVVEESDVPHEVVSKPIVPELLHIEREIYVTVPTIESLLSDKLTAFAPRTIGVPLFPPGRDADTMQIIKQLFDVGELFDLAEDLSSVRRVYLRVFNQENEYRGGGFTRVQALDDTLDAALHLSRHDLKGVAKTPEAEKMADGVRKLSGHLVNHRFNLDAAKITAAKAALLSRLILADGENSLARWRTLPEIKVIGELAIDGPWKQLQRLRKTSPTAFFYWYQAAMLQVKIEGNLRGD